MTEARRPLPVGHAGDRGYRFEELIAQPDFEIVIEAAAPTKRGRYSLTLVANHGDGRLAAGMAPFEVP